jgi:hypothetical protein
MSDGKIEEVRVVSEHYLQDEVYRYKEYYEYANGKKVYINGNNGSKVIKKDNMLPKKHTLNVNHDNLGEPIYASAYKLICDLNKTYSELKLSEELLRPQVGVPSSLLESKRRGLNAGQGFHMSDISPLYVVVPDFMEDGEQTPQWKYFGGTFDPNNYLTMINFLLHMISFHCGLGNKYFSYDQNVGLKTAEEVRYSANDLMINQQMLNQTFKKIFKKLVQDFIYVTTLDDSEKEIEIIFGDSISNSELTYNEKLYKDMIAGVITHEFYVEQSYKKYLNELGGSDIAAAVISENQE